MRLMTALLAGLVAACAAEPETASVDRPTPGLEGAGAAGAVVLTVLTPDGREAAPDEGLFGIYGLTGSAQTFTLADLAALERHVIRTDFPAGAPARDFAGPRLSDVLQAAGAPGASARLSALDGYQATIAADRIAAHEPILALAAADEALAIGGLGPTMLVWPRGIDPTLEDMSDDDWPWGVFVIETDPD